MTTVQFTDLSRTIDVTWGYVLEIATLCDIISGFCEEWEKENITISGKPLNDAMFNLQASELPQKKLPNGETYISIEKHK